MIELDKNQILALFELHDRDVYQKRGRFLARSAVANETILTIVDGKLETIKTAISSDVIIRNIEIGSSAETYIISTGKYIERYVYTDTNYTIDGQEWMIVTAKGKAEAFQYQGEELAFMAPWDERMLCKEGDFLARPVPGKQNDIYRIEHNTFFQTYSKIERESNGGN